MKLLVLALAILFVFDAAVSQRRNGLNGRHGPNMCRVVRVYNSQTKYYGDFYCLDRPVRRICGRPSYVSHECCPGYERISGRRGCVGEKPLENLITTADGLKLSEFTQAVSDSGEHDNLVENGPYTVFAPDNAGYRSSSDSLKKEMVPSDPRDESLVRYHVLPGRFNFTRAKREVLAETLYSGEKVRINRYPFGLYTVNCARISSPDNFASNGLLNVIDRVIEPISRKGSVAEIIMRDDRFSHFQRLLHRSGMVNNLRGVHPLTVFAPTDDAFDLMPDHLRERVDSDDRAAEALVKNHIVKRTYCSEGLVSTFVLRSHENNRLHFRCHRDGTYSVNGVKISDTDMVGNNGVVHAIDEVLIPDTAKDIDTLGRDLDLNEFSDITALAGLTSELRGNQEFTIFAPTDNAFNELEPRYQAAIRNEPGTRRKILDHHTVRGARIKTDDMYGKTKLNTSNIHISLRVSIFRNGVTLDNAKVLDGDKECANGVIHKIDRVMMPSDDNLMRVIEKDPELSKFSLAIKRGGLENLMVHDGEYTVIAPTNQAFNRMPQREFDRLLNDYSRLRNWMERHIINRVVPSCAVVEDSVYDISSRQGENILFSVNSRGEHTINNRYRITDADVMAENGILHKVNTLIPCSACT